jgi:hypothetical protein
MLLTESVEKASDASIERKKPAFFCVEASSIE